MEVEHEKNRLRKRIQLSLDEIYSPGNLLGTGLKREKRLLQNSNSALARSESRSRIRAAGDSDATVAFVGERGTVPTENQFCEECL